MPVENAAVIKVDFVHDDNGELKYAKLFLYDELIAVLLPDVCPGYCRFAARENPLAKPLRDFESHAESIVSDSTV